MTMAWQAVAWYLLVAACGAAGYGVLRRCGVGVGGAAALGRPVALVSAGYVGWLAGCLGVSQWWWVGLAVLPVLLAVGRRSLVAARQGAVLEPEILGAVAFLGVAFLRLNVLAVSGTEKPMDLAIWATLLRPATLPPSDPWLAGFALPYYYWGFVPWVIPARILGNEPDVIYNLLVPTLAAVTAQLGWGLARAIGGGRRAAWLAGVLVVFSGTLDGWRQIIAGRPLGGLDLWSSSRAIKGAITEFPLFTFHLGDLHPHLLAVPLALAALFLACAVVALPRGRATLLVLAAICYGAAAAANPWCAIPLGLGVVALVLTVNAATEQRSVLRWLIVGSVGLGGGLAFLPFWLGLRPPFEGFGLVTTATRWDELTLYLGGGLVPLVLVIWELARRLGGWSAAGRQLSRAAVVALIAVAAGLSGRIALALALVTGALVWFWVWRGRPRSCRPAWALSLTPIALIGLVEVVYVRDPYGGELYRMNTVFKALSFAFTLLVVVGPVLLGWLASRRPLAARAAAVLLVLVGLPQLLSLAWAAAGSRPDGWGGLGWMAPGEEEAVRWLRRSPPGTVVIEAVGEAYSDAGRMASASGVPSVLGWENHERVWRGKAVEEELRYRRGKVAAVYESGEPAQVRAAARALGATHIVIGSVERRCYPEAGLRAVMRSGMVAFAAGECVVVRVGE